VTLTSDRGAGRGARKGATTLARNGHSVALTCHMGALSGRFRRNSMPAIAECLDAGASRIEIDIHSLAGDDYIVYHDRHLEADTDGRGSIGRVTPDDVRRVHFISDPLDRPPLLSEVIARAADASTEIQLDLKDWRLLPDERIRVLSRIIAPMKERIIVSSGQDWNLRKLHRFDPAIRIGFDPGHYLDYAVEGSDVILPHRLGAYGYRDDHPLAFGRTEATADYLRERLSMLVLMVPAAREFFFNFRMVLQMLDDGFNPAAWLHERGIALTVWTPDYTGAESCAWLERLIDAGVDRITTNTAPAWVEAFAARKGTGA
jgi:glycerophosphoryl diester phosphodiesterase